MKDKITITRGEIWLASLEDRKESSIQGGVRPVLIVQNDAGNKFSPTTLAIPLSTKTHKAKLPTHVLINPRGDLNRESFSMAEQIQTIDKSRLHKKIVKLTHNEMIMIERSIMVSLGMSANGMTTNTNRGAERQCAMN